MCLVWIWGNLHFGRNVNFSEDAHHPGNVTKINVPAQVFLCFIIRQMVPNCKTLYVLFGIFQESSSLYFLDMNFAKIALVIVLWNCMSGKRFSCWVMDEKAIDHLDSGAITGFEFGRCMVVTRFWETKILWKLPNHWPNHGWWWRKPIISSCSKGLHFRVYFTWTVLKRG